MITGIACCDAAWGIGKNNHLLVHLPGDMRFFREKTMGTKIVIGRKTLESFPGGKPLPGRDNYVLTGDMAYRREGCFFCHSVEEVLALAEQDKDAVWMICGGASVYQGFLEHMDDAYITKVDGEFGADTFFPDLDAREDFVVDWESQTFEEEGKTYRFVHYVRKTDAAEDGTV